jgi:hypothetical protein
MRFSILTWFFICTVLLGITGVVFSDYLSLDEPHILWSFRTGKGWEEYLARCLSEGRPVYGFLSAIGLKAAGTFANLKYLRILNILFSFLFCLLLFYFFKKKGVQQRISFIASALIFCLPSLAVNMCWAETFPMHISSILSFIAGVLVVEALSHHMGEPTLTKTKEWMYLLGATVLQIVSMLNYQNLAMAFMLPVIVTLFLKPEIPARNRMLFFVYCSFAFGVSIGIYYKIYESLAIQSGVQMSGRAEIGTDVIGKSMWFGIILVEVSKLHLLLFKSVFVKYIFSIAIALILVRDIRKKRFADLFFLFAGSMLLFLPFLIISESWGASRNFGLVAILFTFYSVIRCFEFIRIPGYWATVALISPFVIILYFTVSRTWVNPQREDYEFVKTFSNHLPVLNGKEMTVEANMPLWDLHEKHTFFRYYFDEFNSPIFAKIWTLEPAIKLFYQDKYPAISALDIDKFLHVRVLNKLAHDSALSLGAIYPLDLNYK